MGEIIKIEAESCSCPPYMRGMIFRCDGRKAWVLEGCDPFNGKVQLGYYLLPLTEEEKEREDESTN